MSALPMPEYEWLTPKQVSARYPVSEKTVRRAIASGALRSVGGGRPGAKLFIRADWAEHWWMTRSDQSLF